MLLGSGAAAAVAQGNSEAAHACQDGGYLNYTDADGNPFRNAGQCTRYAAQGGELVPIPVTNPDLSITGGQPASDSGTGAIHGTGFTPNSTIVDLFLVAQPGDIGLGIDYAGFAGPIDGDGAWSTGESFNLCNAQTTLTTITITAVDAAGVSHTETFALSCAG
jgi:hypothetical protein